MSLAENEMVDVLEMIESCDENINVANKGINGTKSQNEDVEKKRTEALKIVSQVQLDLRECKESDAH
jgi:structural maintenance of chromosome 3 (chondroitin sulfate proteoglycan 6)